MKTRFIHQGTELLVVIPEEIAANAKLDEWSEVNIVVRDSELVISSRHKPTLEELIEGITPENRSSSMSWISKPASV